MSKLIFGFDLGVNSVGWAVIREANNDSEILALGTRVVPNDPDFHEKFHSGLKASKNANRRAKRSIRRNNQRFKLRRDKLKALLIENEMYDENLIGVDRETLFEWRARSINEKIELTQLGRVILHLNQKRGFLSNRKSITVEEKDSKFQENIKENQKKLHEKTIGQRHFEEIKNDPYKPIRGRTYLRSDYYNEFDRIWTKQKEFHPNLTGGPEMRHYQSLYDKIGNQTIFYQRSLKSHKNLKNKCIFERKSPVAPTSSPYYQLFIICQKMNDFQIRSIITHEKRKLTTSEKSQIFKALHDAKQVDRRNKLSRRKILKCIGLSPTEYDTNFEELDGNKTHITIFRVLKDTGLENLSGWLQFDPTLCEKTLMSQQGIYQLWHLLYSIDDNNSIKNILVKKLGFTENQANVLVNKVSFQSDFGKISTKALRKLLPLMIDGKMYSEACEEVGYDHSGYKDEIELKSRLEPLKVNSLRNPVVEQILNQLRNISNILISRYGRPGEIRLELIRDLRNNAKQRARISEQNAKDKKLNDEIRNKLVQEYAYRVTNGRDVLRYRVWQETENRCLYCGENIGSQDFLNGTADIEHIIPKSRSFNNASSNKILAHTRCNREKGQDTAYDFMCRQGTEALQGYLSNVERLRNQKNISISKYEFLLMKGSEIPTDFINRQRQDTSYIVTEAVKYLRSICPLITTTTGSVTDFLRDKWGLKELLQELALPVYRSAGWTKETEIRDRQGQIKLIEVPKDWSKRNDNRHHAVDALITAFTSRKIIFMLNNLNKIFQLRRQELNEDDKLKLAREYESMTGETFTGSVANWAELEGIRIEPPMSGLREQAKEHLEVMLVSFKKSSKAISLNFNKLKNGEEQITLVPRGALHEDTIRGISRWYQRVDLNTNLSEKQIEQTADPVLKEHLKERIRKYEEIKHAFSKVSMTKDPIIWKGKILTNVVVFSARFTNRKPVDQLTEAQLSEIIDPRIQNILSARYPESSGTFKKAIKAYQSDPIYLDQEKLKPVRNVKLWDDGSYISLREGQDGRKDYVATGNNHHALIYKSHNGNYSSRLISLFEAVALGLESFRSTKRIRSVIDRSSHPVTGDPFYMSLQRHDLVLLDAPTELTENWNKQKNRKLISKHLFRIQKISRTGNSLDLWLRHHLETKVDENPKNLRKITWERIQSDKNLNRLIKVKIDITGSIIRISND